MPELNDLSFTLRTFLKVYRWRRLDPTPRAALRRPLAECRVALVSSAGLVAPGDEPFSEKVKGGDFSFRVLPRDVELETLEEHHRSDSFDHAGLEADRNLALPLDRLSELATAGEIGEVAPRHISLMGSITAPGRLVKITAPAVAEMLVADQVDIALLVPV